MHNGPAFHILDFPSDFLIGNAQFKAVHEIMESSTPKSIFSSPDAMTETTNMIVLTNMKGSLRSIHVYMNMCYASQQTYVEVKNTYSEGGTHKETQRPQSKAKVRIKDEGTESQPDELQIRKTDAVIAQNKNGEMSTS